MEQVLKERLFFWLFNKSSQEEFEADNYYEIERLIKLQAIEELAYTLLTSQMVIWNIGNSDVIILKTFLNIDNPARMLTMAETAQRLDITISITRDSLYRSRNAIKREINRRIIMNMSEGDILELQIENFNLSNRAVEALLKNNIFEVSGLVELTKQELRALKNMGPKTANEIIDKVHSFGLVFKKESKKTTEETLIQDLETIKEKLYNIDQQMEYLKQYKQDLLKTSDDLYKKLENNRRKKLVRKVEEI